MNDCIIDLSLSTWDASPSCWQNFVKSCDLYNLRKEIDEGLKKYNAVLRPQDLYGHRAILFDTPADKTWFILRWS